MSLRLPNLILEKFLKNHKALLSLAEEGTVIYHFMETDQTLLD